MKIAFTDEERAIAVRYSGANFDKSREITRKPWTEYGDGKWPFNAFITSLMSAVPEQFRDKAKVELDTGCDGDSCILRVTYPDVETEAEVQDRVIKCLQYARREIETRNAHDKAEYERLKRIYG